MEEEEKKEEEEKAGGRGAGAEKDGELAGVIFEASFQGKPRH